ncbi:MAG: type II toxin-antitoxin system Phd/YefM family antitoxin [Anaerolineales bacterium]|nr:type II toxin-antitoxin system Phd/YefM family antitoxin [Anaerolineales bacterium]
MEKTIGMAETKSNLADLVRQVAYGGERFVLERRGRPMAVLISVEEYKRLKELAGTTATTTSSPLSAKLRQRQEMLVARAHRLETQLGDPLSRLAKLLSALPPDGDRFWVDIQEVV